MISLTPEDDNAHEVFKDVVKLKNKRFLQQRKLMDPYAGTLHIWGYITGAVISGELAGFSAGYKYGLGSMIVAHVFTSILMICVSVNLVELTTTLPFTSGSATFAKAAYGGAVGFIIGVAYLCDMIFFGLEACQFLAVVLQTAFETSDAVNFGYWVATIALCFFLNMRPKVFFNVIMGISIVSVLCILVPILVFSSQFNAANAWKTILPDGNITNIWFPFGVWGVIQSFPHSLYLVVCFESLPVSVEEADNVGSNMPRGMFAAVGILLGLSWISLILCAGLPPFASELQKSDIPFLTIFSKLLPDGLGFIVWIIALPPIFASQLSLFYAGTRFVYGLSRSGYLPSILSCTTAHGAPYISMSFISFIWLLFGAILTFQQDSATSPIYLSIGSMFALIAYIVEPLVYIKLKYSLVNIPRPFKISELSGISTSMASFFIAVSLLLGKIATDRFWQWGFLSIVILYITAIPFYYFVMRHNLGNSPEKLFITEKLKSEMRRSIVAESPRDTVSETRQSTTTRGSEAIKRDSFYFLKRESDVRFDSQELPNYQRSRSSAFSAKSLGIKH